MIATLKFPTLLKFPLGGAQEELKRISRMFSGAFRKPFQGAFAAGDAAAAEENWWEAGGATGCIQALQAKGAASYAASLLDLSGNGNNATEGVAPTWNTSTGWSFNGTTQYLKSGMLAHFDWTILIRVANIANSGSVYGGQISTGYWFVYFGGVSGIQYGSGNVTSYILPAATSGVFGAHNHKAYRNGAVDTTIVPVSGTALRELYIGARHQGSATPFERINGDILCLAMYNFNLSDDLVLAVSTAMAAL